ncbi:MAG TPA: TolC family protein [Gemmatimonadaceae bacterium]|nr:TolC family protein [Gemmatimonadaceae bacterium]
MSYPTTAPVRAPRRTGAIAARAIAAGAALALSAAGAAVQAQEPADLDSLLGRARSASPSLRAARARVEAAQALTVPAGTRPDPMFMAGVQNFPVSEPGFSDFMTMKMVGVSQTVPYPGKLSLSRTAAERELAAAQAGLDAARLDAARDVKLAYYDLAYLERALSIVERNRQVLLNTMAATEASYAVGRGGQQDVLRARVEAARLGEEAVSLIEERRAALARLNAVLDRPSETPIATPSFPEAIVRAAVADSASRVRFASPSLGARAADSPLPPLVDLQELAIRHNPVLRAHEARIGAHAARVEYARKAHLPDFDISVFYGHRSGFADMVTAMVSVPIPVQKRRRQDELLAAELAELAAQQAEHHAMVNELRAEVAQRVAVIERDRAQLALYKRAVLPPAHGALEAALAGYRVGRADFLTLLDAQTTVFAYETAYYRALADFARSLAELERAVAAEVIR